MELGGGVGGQPRDLKVREEGSPFPSVPCADGTLVGFTLQENISPHHFGSNLHSG